MRAPRAHIANSGEDAGRYKAILLDDVDLGAARELTIALDGALELTVRIAETVTVQVGAPLRLLIAPEDVAVWAQPPM